MGLDGPFNHLLRATTHPQILVLAWDSMVTPPLYVDLVTDDGTTGGLQGV